MPISTEAPFYSALFEEALLETYERSVFLELPESECRPSMEVRGLFARWAAKHRSTQVFGVEWEWDGPSVPNTDTTIMMGNIAGLKAFREEKARVESGVIEKYRTLSIATSMRLSFVPYSYTLTTSVNTKDLSVSPIW